MDCPCYISAEFFLYNPLHRSGICIEGLLLNTWNTRIFIYNFFMFECNHHVSPELEYDKLVTQYKSKNIGINEFEKI